MPAKIELSYESLNELYNHQNKSQKEIAEIFCCSDQTIRKEFRRLGIIAKSGPILLTHKKFGDWTVLEEYPISSTNNSTKHLCRCKCGVEKYITRSALMLGRSNGCSRCANNEFIDMSGKTIGRWEILHQVESHIGILWKCICRCGQERIIRGCELRQSGHNGCKSCVGYKGYKEISGTYISQIIKGAKSRKLEYNITAKDMWNKILYQNHKCALSGVDIKLSKDYRRNKNIQTASLDRIDSSIGYIANNIQWVHKDINRMKNNFDEKKLFEMCCEIVRFNNLLKDL